jgi:hypothetical protein
MLCSNTSMLIDAHRRSSTLIGNFLIDAGNTAS